ncbi:MAG TPA: Mur ligase family protein, partial [Flavobacterium sp.]|nr:Mur ligase family protein [Flavobacterium sp.]
VDFVSKHKPFFESNDLSFFEMTVGLAFDYFVQENIDIAIIEVGLGGRLDATNIIKPLISVITNIGLDHTQFLGNTIEAIAKEKAGIIKPLSPIVIGEYTAETKPIFAATAKENNAEIYYAADLIKEIYPTELLGDYQFQNRKTVLQTLQVLQNQNEYTISEKNIKDGFMKVIQNTGLLGRWQQVNSRPKVICDTAHNKHGLTIVINQIKKEKYENLHIVLGVVNDKDLNDILPLFPKNATYYFCRPNITRGLNEKLLKEKALTFELIGKVYLSVSEAYNNALKNASPNDFIYIGGSTFVVAEIL